MRGVVFDLLIIPAIKEMADANPSYELTILLHLQDAVLRGMLAADDPAHAIWGNVAIHGREPFLNEIGALRRQMESGLTSLTFTAADYTRNGGAYYCERSSAVLERFEAYIAEWSEALASGDSLDADAAARIVYKAGSFSGHATRKLAEFGFYEESRQVARRLATAASALRIVLERSPAFESALLRQVNIISLNPASYFGASKVSKAPAAVADFMEYRAASRKIA